MVSILLAVAFLGAKPDLTCHYEAVRGKQVLVVSRSQWEGIRRALYKLDRTTLATLISDRRGVDATVHWAFRQPTTEEVHLSKKRFLDIGKDDEYGEGGSSTVSTAVKGDTLYFKWLWVDLSCVEKKERLPGSDAAAYDSRQGTSTWQMYGWHFSKPSHPSSRVFFGSENGRLVIQKIEVTMEPD